MSPTEFTPSEEIPPYTPPGLDVYPSRPIGRTPWPTYFRWLSEVLEPGYHIAILAPTRWGKTHLILRGLVPLWSAPIPKDSGHLLMIDCKDHDDILDNWGIQVGSIPPYMLRAAGKLWDDRAPWYRVRVPSHLSGASEARQRGLVLPALRTAWKERHWTMLLDEIRPLLDMGLKRELIDILERGGSEKMSGVFGTQAPQFMPSQLFDQPRHLFLGRTTDARTLDRYREIGGRTDDIWAALRDLKEHEWLAVSEAGERLEIVKAPA